jgi:hypothetical protein
MISSSSCSLCRLNREMYSRHPASVRRGSYGHSTDGVRQVLETTLAGIASLRATIEKLASESAAGLRLLIVVESGAANADARARSKSGQDVPARTRTHGGGELSRSSARRASPPDALE